MGSGLYNVARRVMTVLNLEACSSVPHDRCYYASELLHPFIWSHGWR
jgi:hypothetical protein